MILEANAYKLDYAVLNFNFNSEFPLKISLASSFL